MCSATSCSDTDASERTSSPWATARGRLERPVSASTASAWPSSSSAAPRPRSPRILYTGRLQGASYTLGEQDLLTVIAAVVIGGTRLFGGEGSVIGALVGSLLMGMLTNGLILWGLTSSEQLIAQGVLLLLAISLTLRGRSGR